MKKIFIISCLIFTILRIFNQKENYLNQRNFILREKSQPYLIIKKKIRSIF